MKSFAMKIPLAVLLLVGFPQAYAATPMQTDPAVERRVVDYLRQHVTPGKPLVVSELYNNVFTSTEERKVLDRLFSTFFKIPVFVAQHKAGTGRIPTLDDISRQFNLRVPGEVQVLLTILESDPRVPKFMTRDAKTGEILDVDIEAVKKDKRFSQAIERTMSGWVGKTAPAFTLELLDGKSLASTTLAGRNFLIYFWFSGCPPCMQLSPHLASIGKQYGGKKFTIVAVNADRLLELNTTDAERAAYVKKAGFRFPAGHMNRKMLEDYGGIGVYPTLFLVDSSGIIRKHYVGYQRPDVLAADIRGLLANR